MGSHAPEERQGETGGAGEETLDQRTADLLAAAAVAGGRDDDGAPLTRRTIWSICAGSSLPSAIVTTTAGAWATAKP